MVQLTGPFQVFHQALQERVPRMLRGCMSNSVVVGPISDGRFTVTVGWTNKDGSSGQHKKLFVASSIFFTNGQFGVKLKRSPCRHADDVIREVLTARKSLRT